MLVLPFILQGQESANYRLIILHFKITDENDSFIFLEKELPEALEPIISRSHALVTLERKQHNEVLEEIEYQYDRRAIFDESTIARLKKQVGANVALVGKVKRRAGEIRVDVKIVEIETGVRMLEDFIVTPESELQKLSQIANKMDVLGRRIRERLELDKSSWVVFVPSLKNYSGITSINQQLGSLQSILKDILRDVEGIKVVNDRKDANTILQGTLNNVLFKELTSKAYIKIATTRVNCSLKISLIDIQSNEELFFTNLEYEEKYFSDRVQKSEAAFTVIKKALNKLREDEKFIKLTKH